MAEEARTIKVAHLSDIHVGSNHFVSNLLNRAITEINDMKPKPLKGPEPSFPDHLLA